MIQMLLGRWFEAFRSLEDELVVKLNESPVISYCFIEFTLSLYRLCSLAQPKHTALMQARLFKRADGTVGLRNVHVTGLCFDETFGIHDTSSLSQFILGSNFRNAAKRGLIICS
jgi:hypothetical protein